MIWQRPLAALIVLALAACAAPQSGEVRLSTSDGPAAIAAVNAYRAQSRLSPIVLDPALTEAAAVQARAMASHGLLSHDAGGSLRTRLVAVGTRDVIAAENLGRGHRTVEAALASWRASSSHARNMRNPEVTRAGFARADAATGTWWALVLAGEPRAGQVWR